MTTLAFLDIGFGEMLVVGFVALVLFGGRLPDVMHTLGTAYRKFRSGMDDLTRQTSKVLDIRPSSPVYKPTPPVGSAPTVTPSIHDEPSIAAPAPDSGPVASSTPPPPVAQVPPTNADHADDPPPV